MNQYTQQQLRIVQQNLNKSLTAQLHLLNTARPTDWDILLVQEPWIVFNGTRATPHWRVLYPKAYFDDNTKLLRSIILINTAIPTNLYEQIQFNTPDITRLILKTEEKKIVIINVYNDCNNNGSIDAVSGFLDANHPDEFMPNNTHIIVCSDFNRHHPWWETEDNTHLLSTEHMIKPLLDLTMRFDLRMVLPHGLPTLQAFSTGNWTRPDNVWCTSHSINLFTTCITDPGTRPPNTDHIPIHSKLDIVPPRTTPKTTRNFRLTDWEKFQDHLTTSLANAPDPQKICTPEEFREALDTINQALKSTIESKVPLCNPLPHTKWWRNQGLNKVRKEKNRLTRELYKWRDLLDHHVHTEHRQATRDYAKLIERSKKLHWETWLTNVADKDLWLANKYTTDPPTDGGKSRMLTLKAEQENGSIRQAVSNEDKSNILAKALFPPPPDTPIVPATCYPKPADEYFHFFTRHQIKSAASKLEAYKAPGPDGIPNVVLKQCINILIDRLYYIFRVIFELNTYLRERKESITVVLRKPGKPTYEDPKAYRPIALLNTLRKLFSTIAADEISFFCESRNLLPATQFGG